MMNLEWNLNELFQEEQDFYEKIKKIKETQKEMQKFKMIPFTKENLVIILNQKWELLEETNNVLIYGSLKYYQNINEEKNLKNKEKVEKLNNEVKSSLSFVDQKIIELGDEKITSYIKENPQLKIYTFTLKNLFRRQQHLQDQATSNIIKENKNEIDRQVNRYNSYLKDICYGNIHVDNQEIELNSSNFVKYLSSKNRKTREETFSQVNNAFKDKEIALAHILNSIYTSRTKNAKLEKYNSVLEQVLEEENINPKIIDSLITSVNENISLMQEYLQIKAQMLHSNKPHLYDFTVPINNNFHKKYPIEEAIDIIKNALKPLGEEYLKIVDKLLNGHIDAIPNKNKHQSIIFSWHTYSFLNYRESYVDLKNLIHEIGHIVNYYLSKENLHFMYEDSTIFVGETASLVNEILLNHYLFNKANAKEEKIFYLTKEIENYFTTVFKQTMYTEFENTLYIMNNTTELTPTILNGEYKKIIQKYYGKNIIYDKLANVEWTRLGHLYRHSYYPYRYATGLIMASVVVDSLINKKELSKEKYIEFLSLGSSMYSLDLLKILNIDLTNSHIITNGLKILESDINELKELLEE